MTVALIAESGIRFMDLPVLLPEIRVPVPVASRLRVTVLATTSVSMPRSTYRRFVKADDHTYIEKD
mgnify:CR=1 FL=1